VKIGQVVSAENSLIEIALRVHLMVWHILWNISVCTDRFSQSFHNMKALYVPIMDVYLIFQFIKGRCHGNQFCSKNDKQKTFVSLASRKGMG